MQYLLSLDLLFVFYDRYLKVIAFAFFSTETRNGVATSSNLISVFLIGKPLLNPFYPSIVAKYSVPPDLLRFSSCVSSKIDSI